MALSPLIILLVCYPTQPLLVLLARQGPPGHREVLLGQRGQQEQQGQLARREFPDLLELWGRLGQRVLFLALRVQLVQQGLLERPVDQQGQPALDLRVLLEQQGQLAPPELQALLEPQGLLGQPGHRERPVALQVRQELDLRGLRGQLGRLVQHLAL